MTESIAEIIARHRAALAALTAEVEEGGSLEESLLSAYALGAEHASEGFTHGVKRAYEERNDAP